MIRKRRGEVLSAVGYSVGRGLQCVAMFFASDFLHNGNRSVVLFAAVTLSMAAVVFLSAQQAWGTLRTTTRRQFAVYLQNGLRISLAFTLLTFGLKFMGPLASTVLEYATYGIPFALAFGSLPVNKKWVSSLLPAGRARAGAPARPLPLSSLFADVRVAFVPLCRACSRWPPRTSSSISLHPTQCTIRWPPRQWLPVQQALPQSLPLLLSPVPMWRPSSTR
jgi:hypothetical protein